jgi:hypothetical protein
MYLQGNLKMRGGYSPASRRYGPGSSLGSSSHVGFVVDKDGIGTDFLRVLRFSCQFSFHRLLYDHHLSSGAATVGKTVANVPSGLSLTSEAVGKHHAAAPQKTNSNLTISFLTKERL